MMAVLEIPIPQNMWFTSNIRLHWAVKARRTRKLRELAGMIGGSEIHRLRLTRPVFDRCRVSAAVAYPTNARADPANTSPVVKALIDGLTDAGFWADDDSKHVVEVSYRRSPTHCPRGRHVITLTITPT